ncbi:hypothetical protein [Fluviicola sp.]|uniref:hypothetical protein n=1 Tax=Fluviicola sp. TaxID=1917219 RepID=UPI0031DE5564
MKSLLAIILLSVVTLSSCNMKGFKKLEEESNKAFGDQHFKTAISLIELHKVRTGSYPESLDSLKYLGDWDQIVYGSVKYKKLVDGYELDLTKGWIGKPKTLKYPADFWKGLGCKKSNLK